MVKLEMLEDLFPQCLHTYCDFSLPSYNACFPLLVPSGCLEQELIVKLETLEALFPQYLQ